MKNFTLRKMAIVAIALFTMSISAIGQGKGDMGVGGNLAYGAAGSNSFTNYGIGGRFLYNVTNLVRLDGSMHYFFEKDNITVWTVGFKGNYLFPIYDQLTVYPLAGLGIMGLKAKYDLGNHVSLSVSDSKLSFIIGAGADFKLTEKIMLNVEPNIWLFGSENGDINETSYRLMLTAGVIFKL